MAQKGEDEESIEEGPDRSPRDKHAREGISYSPCVLSCRKEGKSRKPQVTARKETGKLTKLGEQDRSSPSSVAARQTLQF